MLHFYSNRIIIYVALKSEQYVSKLDNLIRILNNEITLMRVMVSLFETKFYNIQC